MLQFLTNARGFLYRNLAPSTAPRNLLEEDLLKVQNLFREYRFKGQFNMVNWGSSLDAHPEDHAFSGTSGCLAAWLLIVGPDGQWVRSEGQHSHTLHGTKGTVFQTARQKYDLTLCQADGLFMTGMFKSLPEKAREVKKLDLSQREYRSV